MDSISAVVVTFNRLALLKGCIESLRQQSKSVKEIIVVNNGSTDGTKDWLNAQNDLFVIHQDNVGGAGGFHRGMKEAFTKRHEWIWIMDDDCIVNKECLHNMVISLKLNKEKIYCVAPTVIDRDGKIDVRHRGYFNFLNNLQSFQVPIDALNEKDIIVEFASFVGLMVNSYVIEQVGLPMKDFFINNDDVEYCLRINRLSKIILSKQATIFHLETTTSTDISKRFLYKKKDRITIDKLWIKYYGIRNMVWIKKKYMFNAFSIISEAKLLFFIIISLFRNFKAVILYDDNKYKRFKFYISAYKDGWNGVFDNEKPKKILY